MWRGMFGVLLASMLALLAAPVPAQQYTAGDLTIERPWSRATPEGARTAGAYLVIHNRGEAADRLLGASTPTVRRVEVHEMAMDGAIMRMRHLPQGLELPAGGTATLKPGGIHLMLIDLQAPLRRGGKLPLTLRFEKAGWVTVEFAIEALGAAEPQALGDKPK